MRTREACQCVSSDRRSGLVCAKPGAIVEDRAEQLKGISNLAALHA